MERRDWLVYPWQVDARVARWLERHPDTVRAEWLEQYTRHKVWSVAVSDWSAPAEAKRTILFCVPHAHEPAGTAGCMNAIEQLVSGRHLDGAPSTLDRERILQAAVLLFIPDGNPYGRSRCPEPVWEGRRYNNREFINMVFGIGALYSTEPAKPRWETFKRVSAFSVREEAPARIGLAYEQVDEYDYVEPGRGDDRATLARAIRRLGERYALDHVLALHQTEFEGREGYNCMAMLPGIQAELPEPLQRADTSWAEALNTAWRRAGGSPTPIDRGIADRPPAGAGLHRRGMGGVWHELQAAGPYLVAEIQNNSPLTPAEDQLLLMDTAIWASVAHLLDDAPEGAPTTPA